MPLPDAAQSDFPALLAGYCYLDELEGRIRAFELMNQLALKKRYILLREDLHAPLPKEQSEKGELVEGEQSEAVASKRPDSDAERNRRAVAFMEGVTQEAETEPQGELLLARGSELTLGVARKIRRQIDGNPLIEIYQPDDGIVVVSDLYATQGVAFSRELLFRIEKLCEGQPEGFLVHYDSCSQLLREIGHDLFPRIVVIGYFTKDRFSYEMENFYRARRIDPYFRSLDVCHRDLKPNQVVPGLKTSIVDPLKAVSWSQMERDLIREYNKPYYVDD